MSAADVRTPGGSRADADQSIKDVASIARSGLDHVAFDQGTIRAGIEGRDEHFAGLRARARIAGYEVSIIAAGDGTSAFMISRWGRTVDLPDAAEVSDWLDRIGAP